MSEQQPELRWAPIPPKPSNRRRIWLIVGLSVLAVVIVGVVLWFLLPRDPATPEPTPSATSTSTPSGTPTPSASPSATPTDGTAPEPSVEPTPPQNSSPDLSAFRERVNPRLADAARGLDMVEAGAPEVVDQLRIDAMILSDEIPAEEIAGSWNDRVSSYLRSLDDLASALSSGDGAASALSATRADLDALRSLVGS